MKDIISKITEAKSTGLWSEVQNEVTKACEYHTYVYSDGEHKFKKGFILYNNDQQFVSINGYNNFKDYIEMLGVDEKEYKEVDSINVGECITIEESQILRIW